jgi:hypothetical protein
MPAAIITGSTIKFTRECDKTKGFDIKDEDGDEVIIPKDFICRVDIFEDGEEKISTLSYTDANNVRHPITFKKEQYVPHPGEPAMAPPSSLQDFAEVVASGGARRSKSRKNRNNRRSRNNRQSRRSNRRN